MATILSPRERATQAENLTLVEAVAEPFVPGRNHYHHILTIEPARFIDREHARVFRASHYLLRAVRAWHHAVEWVEQGNLDVVLLDADAIDVSVSALNVSTQRIVTLLRRAAEQRPLIIAIVSDRDFAEMDHVLSSGVDVFVSSAASPMCLIQRIEAVRARTAYHATERIALSA